MASCVFSQTNLPSLFLSDMCFGNSPLHLKKRERPVPRKGVEEGRREEEKRKGGVREREKWRERVGLNFCDASHPLTPETHKE